jgi:hypothetical protein
VEPFGGAGMATGVAASGLPATPVPSDLVQRHIAAAEARAAKDAETGGAPRREDEQFPCVLEGCSDLSTLLEGSRLLTLTPHRFTYSAHHFPGGIFKLVETLSYPTPQGVKTISRAGVDDQLQKAGRPFVTDLLPDRYAVTADQLGGVLCTTVDEARFALVAMTDLIVERKIFNPDGTLTGLAKRDLKKNCVAVSAAASAPTAASSAAPAATAAPSAGGRRGGGPVVNGLATSVAATGVEVEKNTRGILVEKCVALYPYIPADKQLSFAIEQDPTAPRHKPRYKATVTITGLKGKQTTFVGEWCGTKRDAEITACSAALVVMSRMK